MRSSIQKLKSYFGLGLVCSEFNGNTITCPVDEKKVWWIQIQGAGLEKQDSKEMKDKGINHTTISDEDDETMTCRANSYFGGNVCIKNKSKHYPITLSYIMQLCSARICICPQAKLCKIHFPPALNVQSPIHINLTPHASFKTPSKADSKTSPPF